MFDPFKDFETSGYLRNKFAEKDSEIVQELKHQMFRASLDEAIEHLAKRRGAFAMKISESLHLWRFYPVKRPENRKQRLKVKK